LGILLETSLTNEKSSSVSSTEDLAELAAIQEDVGLLRLLNSNGSVQAWNDKGEKGDITTFEVSMLKRDLSFITDLVLKHLYILGI
jgi:hypothetical protein